MLRRLPLALSLVLLACPSPCECPVPTTSPATPSAALPTPADPPTTPPAPTLPELEPLELAADDGHPLRMWRLATREPTPRGAILLLHGRTWSGVPDFDLRVGEDRSLSLMQRLSDAGYVTYALDLRGYGGTARDASGWLEPARAAADLASALAFVREREGRSADLLGWSFGALVGQLCAQQRPELVRTLTLYGYPRDPDARTKVATSKGEPPRQQNGEAAAKSDFITPGTISQAAIDAYVSAALAADPIKTDWRAVHQFDALDSAKLAVPTLVIHGVHDPIADPLWQAKLFTRVEQPDKQWVVIPNADHAAHLEQPERFVAALLAFVERPR